MVFLWFYKNHGIDNTRYTMVINRNMEAIRNRKIRHANYLKATYITRFYKWLKNDYGLK